MALFNRGKKNTVPSASSQEKSAVLQSARDLSAVLLRPRITEKATLQSEGGVYVFEINRTADKSLVTKAVQKFYNVTTRKVRIVTIPSKKIAHRRKRGVYGTTPIGKKAYVYLKKGETLEIV